MSSSSPLPQPLCQFLSFTAVFNLCEASSCIYNTASITLNPYSSLESPISVAVAIVPSADWEDVNSPPSC